MAITRYAGDRFYGLDAEKSSLLSKVIDGAIYNASDTLFQYVKINGSWVLSSGGSGSSGSSGSRGSSDLPDQVVPAVQVDQAEKAQITEVLQQILLTYLL